MSKSNDDSNNKHAVPDVSGKWNLSYLEMAKLIKDNGEGITDASSVNIVERHFNPFEPVTSLDITKLSNHGFEVIMSHHGHKDTIHGSLNGAALSFMIGHDSSNKNVKYSIEFDAISKGDYLSATVTIHKIKVDGDKAEPILAGIGYLMFLHEGSEPVPIRSDFFDMKNVIGEGNPIRSVIHSVNDFSPGKTGEGKDIGTKMTFVKSHSMVSVFSVKAAHEAHDEGGTAHDVVGVQVVVSQGIMPSGTVFAHTAGYIDQCLLGGTPFFFEGEMVMAHGKASFYTVAHQVITDPSHQPTDTIRYFEVEYNVPYQYGGDLSPVFLSTDNVYKGTVTVRSMDKDGKINTKTKEISKSFLTYDNTVYSEIQINGHKIIWFGEIHGRMLDIVLIDGSNQQVGHLTGHITDDGSLHVHGMMHKRGSPNMEFLEYELRMVEE